MKSIQDSYPSMDGKTGISSEKGFGAFPDPWKAAGWFGVFALLGILATFLYIVGYGGYLGGQAGASGGVIDPASIQAEVETHLNSPTGMMGVYIVQLVLILPVLLVVAKSPIQPAAATLAWRPFPVSLLAVWVPVLLVYFLLQTGAVYLFDVKPGEFMATLAGSRHLGLALVVVLAAPLLEELVFRGYLFRAWRHTPLGLSGTLVLTSLLFTLMHWGQYSWVQMGFIFTLAFILGLAREKSGSLLLPLALHGLNNLAAAITVIYLGVL